MRIPINQIRVNPGRRKALPEHIEELAKSIAEIGLLNPITVDHDFNLIAGLHRLEAVRILGWSEIECMVSSLEGLQAELAEIDENFVRRGLSTVEFGELLLRRKEIYEALHPETKYRISQVVAMNRIIGNNVGENLSSTSKPFTEDTADKLGVVRRTVERQIQTAKNLTPEAKEILRHIDVSRENALKISRFTPEQQREAACLLASGEIKSANGYLLLKNATPAGSSQQGKENVPITKDSSMSAQQEQTSPASQKPKLEDTPMTNERTNVLKACKSPHQEKGDCAEKAEDKPDGLDKIKNNTREQEMSSSQPPYSLGGVKYAASIFFCVVFFVICCIGFLIVPLY